MREREKVQERAIVERGERVEREKEDRRERKEFRRERERIGERESEQERERESEQERERERESSGGLLPPLFTHSAPSGGARPGRRPGGDAGWRRPPAGRSGAGHSQKEGEKEGGFCPPA